jgi:hypothetical protein
MSRPARLPAAMLFLFFSALFLCASPDKPSWPLTLREGLPGSLPGYAPAPTDTLPEEAENEMGPYVEASRFFQRIESPSSTKQFRIAVQDYGDGKDLLASLRKAFAEAKKTSGVETREMEISGHKTFVVTDRSTGRPTTLVTVIVLPSRLVLGQGANVSGEEAVQLVKSVDFAKVVAVKR